MKNNTSLVYSLFLLLGDFVALVAAFAAAYVLRFQYFDNGKLAAIGGENFLRVIVSILPIWLLVHAFIGLYRQEIYEKRFVEIGRLFVGAFLGTLLIIGYDFLAPEQLLPGRLVPVYALIIGFALLVIFRTLARSFRRLLYRFGGGVSNILIIGDTVASEDIVYSMSDTRVTGIKVLGIVGRRYGRFSYFKDFESATAKLDGQEIHGIIQTELYRDQARNNEILLYAQTHHIAYRFVPGNADLFVGNITVELFAGLPVIAVHQTALVGWGRVVKRLFDLMTTTLAMIVALPLMFIISLLILLFDHKGGIFFTQIRLTRFNREFKVYKFRTMKQAYSGMTPEAAFKKMGRPELAKQYRDNGDSLENDPRISRLGHFLRSTSLDELPQLINVLKGDVSLVGPRALIPQELNSYAKKHAILSVKSGLTGLAVVSGRRDISFDERRKLDVYYVQNWSFWFDISILLRTIRMVINRTGAR